MRSVILGAASGDKWERINPSGMYERDFVPFVLAALERAYPDALVMPFAPEVKYRESAFKPDLALIDKRFQYWYVIEAETDDHHLRYHVLPQCVALRDGEYGVQAAKLLAKAGSIEKSQAETLLKYIPRHLAVISTVHNREWEAALKAEGIEFLSLSMFSADGAANPQFTLLQGSLAPPSSSIGFGRIAASVRAINLGNNPFWEDGKYRIIDPIGVSTWTCVRESASAWLFRDQGPFNLPDGRFVQFLKEIDDTILMRFTLQ